MDTSHGNQPCNRTNYTDGAAQQEYTALVRTNLHYLDKRYWPAAQDSHSTKPLFEQIGEDFGNPSEEIRRMAVEAFCYVFPVFGGNLMDSLDERETHYPNWRHERGKDQRFVNAAMDVMCKLFEFVVIEGKFKPKKGQKDPRPYVYTMIDNEIYNQERKDNRLTYHDEKWWDAQKESPTNPLLNKLSTESAEDEVLCVIGDQTFRRELIQTGYLSEREFELLYALCVEEWDTEELARSLGVTPGAIRERKSVYLGKIAERIIFRRDYCLAQKLFMWFDSGKPISFEDQPEWVVNRIDAAIQPTLRACFSLDDAKLALLPLTAGIGRYAGRLYAFTQRLNNQYLKSHLLAYPATLQSYDYIDLTRMMINFDIWNGRKNRTGFFTFDKLIDQIQNYMLIDQYSDLHLHLGVLQLGNWRKKSANIFSELRLNRNFTITNETTTTPIRIYYDQNFRELI